MGNRLRASLVSYPDYPGSKEQNNLIVPFPYITYRSDAFTIDQREIKKPLYEYRNLEFDLSVSGTIPVSSKDNKAREGMDDLDGSIGIGPVVKARLYRNDLNEFKFEWPVRWVLASDFQSIHEEGFFSSPGFYYYFRQGFSARERLKITLAHAPTSPPPATTIIFTAWTTMKPLRSVRLTNPPAASPAWRMFSA